jgi:radical SAM superfamily enzyme
MTENEALEATLMVLDAVRPDMVVHRMTSDPHPEELAAPVWMLDRKGVRARLEKTMQERDFRQGSKYDARCNP